MKRYRYPYADLFAHARREKAKRLALEAGYVPADRQGAPPRRGSVQMFAACARCGDQIHRWGFRGPWVHTSTVLTKCQDQSYT